MHACSDVSKEAGEQMIGTAGHYGAYLLLEAALPWKRDLLQSPDMLTSSSMLSQMAAQYDFRTLFLSPSAETIPGIRTVVWLQLQKETGSYDVQEYRIPKGKENTVIPHIIAQSVERLPYLLPQKRRHILVCVDGGRDVCCGTKGYPLLRQLETEFHNDPDVTVRGCSHLGGHRFAPTAVDFPQARSYGRISLEKASDLFRNRLSWQEILPMYRGNACLDPQSQHIEAYLLHEGVSESDIITSLLEHYTLEETGKVEVIGSCGEEQGKAYPQYRVVRKRD